MSLIGKGKCLKCGRDGDVRRELLVEHVHPLFKDYRTFLGKFQVVLCDACFAQAVDKKRKGVLEFRSFWALIFLIGAGILFFFPLRDSPKVLWAGPLAVSFLIGIYAARKIKSPSMLEADVLNDAVLSPSMKWGLNQIFTGTGPDSGVPALPMTEEAILGVLHPEIDKITGFTCDKCGRTEATKPGYRWPLVAYRVHQTDKQRGNVVFTLTQRTEAKDISIDVCHRCFHGGGAYMYYKDFYTQMMKTATKKAKSLFGNIADFSLRDREFVSVCTRPEFERVVASASPDAPLKFERL